MSRKRRRELALRNASAAPDAGAGEALPPVEPPLPRSPALWLALAFLLPNLGALLCGFVLDDLPLIAENQRIQWLSRLPEVWSSGYWPDRSGIATYRPMTQTVWALVRALGGGKPWVFHAVNLALGAAVVALVWALLRRIVSPFIAFAAALLFALFPIHTEATTSVVGSAELLAALFGLSALLAWHADRRLPALVLYAAAVFSKESGAAVAGVAGALALLHPGWKRRTPRLLAGGAGAGAVVIAALLLRARTSSGPSFIPPVDNPMALVDPARRVITALWVQVLYAWKTLVPLRLSADYSYKQVPLVMGLGDARAWAGLALFAASAWAFWKRPGTRVGLALWWILFLPAANLLFPIGTLMGERLAYLPSLGLAVLAAAALVRTRRAREVLAALALLYGARSAARNLDWRDAERFYTKLVATAPASAKAHYFHGTLLSSKGDDAGAVAAYDEAIAIFPAYSEAFHNRGNALARLGRREEAAESYRQCLRFDAGHAGAATNLRTLEAGLPLSPPRRKL